MTVSPTSAPRTTDERSPGYDILDVTGRVAGTTDGESIQATPIEVKAVAGEPPYTVRFTVNKFRQTTTSFGTGHRIESNWSGSTEPV